MAISDGNDDKKPNTVLGASFNAMHESATKTAEEPKSTGEARRSRNGIMDVNSHLRGPMSRKSTGEVVSGYQTAFLETMKSNLTEGFEDHFRLIVLDNNTNNVGPYSSLLLCLAKKVDGVNHLAVYTMVVEASGPERLNPKVCNYHQRNVETRVVTGDVFQENLRKKISEYVTTVYGIPMSVIDAGDMVIPREMTVADSDLVRRVIYNASQACFTVMDTVTDSGNEPFNIGWIDKNETLVARLDYNPGQAESATGAPIRSDVRVTLQATTNGSRTDDGFEQTKELGVVEGYVNLVYSPPLQIPGQAVSTQHFVPQVVITGLDSQLNAITMELQLLALAQATLLNTSSSWAGVFKPNHHTKGMDMRDIGAIGYQVNMTGDPNAKLEKIDTKSKSFGDNEFYQLITMNVQDSVVYTLHVEESGELSWIHQTFAAAATKDGNFKVANTNAYSMIMNAANNLTMGHFGRIFNDKPITFDDDNRILLGYYIDAEGVRRDIRDIDSLALLNIVGKEDLSVVWRYNDTFDRKDIPLDVRLEDRERILMSVLPNCTIKGYARSYTFNPEFMIALNVACMNAGLVVRPNNLIFDMSGNTVRGNANIGRFAVGGNDVSGLFNYGGANPWGNNSQGGGQYQGRFGR